jgi:lysyl-tRNA synthetase class 2
MKWIAVDSTTLRSLAYDADRRLLQIEFQDRSQYQYFDVPVSVQEAFLGAPSKGAYFNQFIRPRFGYAQVKAASLS